MHRRTLRSVKSEFREQQQQPSVEQTPRERRAAPERAETGELGAGHIVQSDVQPVPARVLPGVSAGVPDALEHAASLAAERESEGAVPVDADGAGLSIGSHEGGGLQERSVEGEFRGRGGGFVSAGARAAPARHAHASPSQRAGLEPSIS